MKLSQLKFFCTVVECKTIAAARELHCVPSNVTLRLRELEESLGGELFSATRTGCTSIPKGDCSISRRATLWRRRSAAAAVRRRASAWAAEPRGAGFLAGQPFTGAHCRLRRLQPHLHINVLSRDSLVLERMLIDSDLDLAITDGPIEHPLLASQKAFDERLVLLMPADAGNRRRHAGAAGVLRSAANVRFA